MAEPLKKLFTCEEYYAMAEAGILKPEDRVELVEGEIFRMPPIGNRHAGCVNRLVRWFSPLVATDRGVVSPQNPVHLSEVSEPQPDMAVLRPRADFYAEAHPTPEDVLLLVEVADTSADHDRRKLSLYARRGILEVWFVILGQATIEVHRDPSADGYRSVRRLRRGDSISPQAFPELEIAVDAILG